MANNFWNVLRRNCIEVRKMRPNMQMNASARASKDEDEVIVTKIIFANLHDEHNYYADKIMLLFKFL